MTDRAEDSTVISIDKPLKRPRGRPRKNSQASFGSDTESEYLSMNERELGKILNERFEFRYDVCTNSVEYRDYHEEDENPAQAGTFFPSQDVVDYRVYGFARTHGIAADCADLRSQKLIRQAIRCSAD